MAKSAHKVNCTSPRRLGHPARVVLVFGLGANNSIFFPPFLLRFHPLTRVTLWNVLTDPFEKRKKERGQKRMASRCCSVSLSLCCAHFSWQLVPWKGKLQKHNEATILIFNKKQENKWPLIFRFLFNSSVSGPLLGNHYVCLKYWQN